MSKLPYRKQVISNICIREICFRFMCEINIDNTCNENRIKQKLFDSLNLFESVDIIQSNRYFVLRV